MTQIVIKILNPISIDKVISLIYIYDWNIHFNFYNNEYALSNITACFQVSTFSPLLNTHYSSSFLLQYILAETLLWRKQRNSYECQRDNLTWQQVRRGTVAQVICRIRAGASRQRRMTVGVRQISIGQTFLRSRELCMQRNLCLKRLYAVVLHGLCIVDSQ